MKFDLKNKIALITGATSGIGASLAKLLISKYNCTVFAVGRNEQKANAIKQELGENGDKYIPIIADLSTEEGLNKVIQVGYFDVLFNNAGIMPPFCKTENQSIETYEKVMYTNFFVPIKIIDFVLKNNQINPLGAIVNISSSDALCPIVGTSPYSASKAALASYSEVLSQETSLTICTVYPGFTKTNLFTDISFSDGLISKMASCPTKTAQTIINALIKRKRRIIVGQDAKWMDFLYKIAPVKGPLLIKKILKKSGKDAFNSL